MVAFRGTPGEMQITQKAPVKVCDKSSTLSGVYNSITFSEQSPGSVCRGEHSAIHKLYFPLCKAHTRAPSEARWMENTQSALNIARTLSQVTAFSVSETTVVIFIYNGCLCRCVSCSIVERKQLLVESSFREMKRTARSRSETWVCLFIFIFFFSEFILPPRSWQEYFCKLCALSFGWKALSETCVNFSRGTQPERQNLRRQTGRRKSRKRSWKWHELFQDTFDQLTNGNTTSEWGGGGNAVSWSKQPLSLIIITELQLDLEPHQNSGRSVSMESLTLRWINEGIIMRFCKTHSCVRGQKHPIVLQPWQENLAVNTLVLKLGL